MPQIIREFHSVWRVVILVRMMMMTFGQLSSTFRATSSAQHLQPSGVLCCWTNCLELTAWWPTWSKMFWKHFQTVTKNVFVFTVLVCSAH